MTPLLGAFACTGCVAAAVLGSVGGATGTAAVLGTASGVAGVAGAGGATAAATGTVATVATTGAAVAGTGVAVGVATAGVGSAVAGGTLATGGVLGEVAVAGGGATAGAGAAAGSGLVNTQVIGEVQAGLPPATSPASLAAQRALALQISARTLFIPNEILVTNLSAAGLRAARARGYRFTEAGTLNNLALTTVRLQPPPGVSVEAALPALRQADPDGRYERNPVYRLAGGAACEGLRCYAQQLVRWPGGCDAAVRLGLLDGAVDAQHPALAGRRVETRRFAPGVPAPAAREHATAIAALLAGAAQSDYPGLLPNSQLFAADVFSTDADGAPYTDAARLAAGLDWLAGHAPSVINISLAGPDSALLHTAIRRLVQSGTGVVAAVGNLGAQAPPQYPAAYPEVVGVTAVDRRLHVYAHANQGGYVALAAPGVGIWTAGARYRDGTSFAAPFVAAAYSVTSGARSGRRAAAERQAPRR